MKKGFIKKLKLVGIMMVTCLSLTGCGGLSDVLSGAGTTVNNRLQINKNLLQILKDSGLLTDAMYESLMNDLTEKSKLLLKVSETDADDVLKKLKPNIGYAYYTGKNFSGMASSEFSSDKDKSKDDWEPTWADTAPTLKTFCDYGDKNKGLSFVFGGKDKVLTQYLGTNDEHTNAVAYELFNLKDQNNPSTGLGSLNTIVNTEIYVLNYDALKGADISDIAISCKTIKDLSGKESRGELTDDEKQALADARSNLTVFKPSGMTLMDGIDGELVRDTEHNKKAFEVADEIEGTVDDTDDPHFKNWAIECKEGDVNPVWNTGSNLKDSLENMKYDLAIFSDACPVLSIKLRELNPDVVLALQEKCLGMGDAYLIDYVNGDPAQGKRIYKMVYPASYVSSIKWDGSKTSFTSEESEFINVNIMTGEVALKEESTLLSAEEKQKLEKIYNVTGNSDNQSSFTIWDVVDTQETLDDGTQVNYKQNSILLKDYLEYTYLPDFIPGEPFVALGRRIRLYNFEKDGTFKDPNEIGRFIDKAGHPVDGVNPLSTDDLLDIKSGNSDNERKAIKSTKSMASGGSMGGGGSSGGSGGSSSGGSSGGSSSGGSSGNSPSSGGSSSGGSSSGGNSSSGGSGGSSAHKSGNSDPTEMGAENPNNAPYLAGKWDEDPSDGTWKFKQLDGTYLCNTWAWIDGDGDGTAECYWFNDEFIMEWSCDIDGHEVGDSGAMLDENGDIVTKAVSGRTPDNEGITSASISVHQLVRVMSALNGGNTSSTPGSEPSNAPYIEGDWEEDSTNGTWKFMQANGEYAKGKWAWIDSDGDGTAYCYRFEDNELLYTNGMIDGYNVSDSGEYQEHAVTQTKDVSNMTPTNGGTIGNNGGVVVGNTGQNDTGFASDLANHRFDEYEYIDELHPIALFPVDDDSNDFRVAGTDAMYNGQDKSRTIMYGMCTDVSMFDSQLYSAWINVNGDGGTAGSLDWWNAWLEQAKFDYRIDKEALMEYLGMNFTADMLDSDDAAIILDVDTIKKIKDDMDEDDKVYRVTFIRTMFVIIGYLTMVYAFLFLAAWVIDVSTIGETKFMTIMTGGRCVAIRDEIERPYYDDSGTAYLTFGNALVRCIIMLALSLILTRMDFIAILVKSFGKMSGVTQELFKRIFNR